MSIKQWKNLAGQTFTFSTAGEATVAADAKPTVFNTPLVDQSADCWDNSILYRLAYELGYPVTVAGPVDAPKRVVDVDPDEVLERAVKIIRHARLAGVSE